jgi:hypothetical protein
MRDPDRIEPTLNILGKIWRKYPDLRLGQLIGAATAYYNRDRSTKVEEFYIEDTDLLKGALLLDKAYSQTPD